MKKKEKTNPKNGSCKCWRFDSIIIKDNFLAVLRFFFFFGFSPQDWTLNISLNSVSSDYFWRAGVGGWHLCVVVCLFCFYLKIEESKTPVVKRR